MHNNKKNDKADLEASDMIYIRKEDLDNGITYGAFNNMNENEEYTKDKPRPNKGTYYLIKCVSIETFN